MSGMGGRVTRLRPGRSFPPGATVSQGGTNFCVFSRNCDWMELLLFDRADSAPSDVIRLDGVRNRTFYYWHIFLEGIGHGQLYGWRAGGPYEPRAGLLFRGDKLLLDPYTRAVVTPSSYHPDCAVGDGDNAAQMMKSVVVDLSRFDWHADHAPLREPGRTIIYEMHVAGFTRHPSSGVPPAYRGTYQGVVEKIPYLRELGVTAVELMPVQAFDPYSAPRGHTNYWGYSPVAFFAPHAGYAISESAIGQGGADAGPLVDRPTGTGPTGPMDARGRDTTAIEPAAMDASVATAAVDEFRSMVLALHRSGIRVILDVVYNHTAEGDEAGPTLSFRGLENRAYYILDPNDRSRYANYSGCGNTVNGNQSIVRRLILDSLRYWVSEMHVDAFRFDLASVLARDEWGTPLKSPPILWEIESDPVLAGTPLIAEAWDAAGLYQVGSFIGHRWAEWNGRFRDDVRRFFRGDDRTVPALIERIVGSPDLYPDANRDIERTVNFITAHDGFTLMDLVSYSTKHNEANGEENRDGSNENLSWNCGAEGPTDDPAVLALRQQQMRNFFVVLLLSQGTPMVLMGDEMGRSQGGNNNAYCQDNPTSWMNWDDLARNGDLYRFVRRLIVLRDAHPAWASDSSWVLEPGRMFWGGVRSGEPDLGDWSHTLTFVVNGPGPRLYVVLNAFHDALDFGLPTADTCWRRLIDTSAPSGQDFLEGDLPGVLDTHVRVAARSVQVLVDGAHRFPFE